jgi:hypothetical protein
MNRRNTTISAIERFENRIDMTEAKDGQGFLFNSQKASSLDFSGAVFLPQATATSKN